MLTRRSALFSVSSALLFLLVPWATALAANPPLAFDVSGITDGSRINGSRVIRINVTAGSPKDIQLLVDDQVRATVSSAPYTFTWDTTRETIGSHTVIVRATDPTGQIADKRFVVEVTRAEPAGAAVVTPPNAPTAVPTSTPAVVPTAAPTVAPTPAPTGAISASEPIMYGAAGVGVLALLAGGSAYALSRRKSVSIAPVSTPPATKPVRIEDRTEQIVVPKRMDPELTVARAGGTIVSADATALESAASPPPRPMVRVAQASGTSDVLLDRPEAILGRDPANAIVIQDPMASRRHARIYRDQGGFWVEDLKSLNGTKVNDAKIVAPYKLAQNDQIKIGEVTLTFTFG